MKYCYLGKSGLIVSRICLGSATFGEKNWGCGKDAAFEVLNTFVENGGNFIDTANSYGDGHAEEIIGEWLKNKERDALVIATKCFFKTDQDVNSMGLSRKNIVRACDNSLIKLKTDYIDLYQVHNQDPRTPIEETLGALDYLIKQGKIRYTGCSNFSSWMLIKAFYEAEKYNYNKFISGQYLYNLLKRDFEQEIMAAVKETGMKIICWSPLSGGFLSGKYTDPVKPPDDTRMMLRYDLSKDRYSKWYEKSVSMIEALTEVANKHEQTLSVIALAWLLKNEFVAAAVVGARKPEQITDNRVAGEWMLPDDDYELLNKQSAIEPGYPRQVYQNWFDGIL